MTILTIEYKFKVFLRLLKTNESFKDACSKSGLTFEESKKLLALNFINDKNNILIKR